MSQVYKAIGATAAISIGALSGLATAQGLEALSAPNTMHGALESAEAKAPLYDGPVSWGHTQFQTSAQQAAFGTILGLIAGGIAGGIGGAIVREKRNADFDAKDPLVGALTCMLIAGGIGGRLAYNIKPDVSLVSFPTTISSVVTANPPHEEVVSTGKRTVIESPFYSGVVTIPETELYLAANSFRAPLIAGEKIDAKFYIDAEGHIISWFATPGAR